MYTSKVSRLPIQQNLHASAQVVHHHIPSPQGRHSRDLTGADLWNRDLRGADLSRSDLRGANLTCADLTGATLRESNLSGADLTRANLTNVDLTHANLCGVASGDIIGEPSSLPMGWRIVNGYLVGPRAFLWGADLAGQELRDVDLRGADLWSADLREADLTQANLRDSNLTSSNLSGATLASTNMWGTVLNRAEGVSITGQPAFLPVGWSLLGGTLFGPELLDSSSDEPY